MSQLRLNRVALDLGGERCLVTSERGLVAGDQRSDRGLHGNNGRYAMLSAFVTRESRLIHTKWLSERIV